MAFTVQAPPDVRPETREGRIWLKGGPAPPVAWELENSVIALMELTSPRDSATTRGARCAFSIGICMIVTHPLLIGYGPKDAFFKVYYALEHYGRFTVEFGKCAGERRSFSEAASQHYFPTETGNGH